MEDQKAFGNRKTDMDVISRVSTLEGHVERFHEDIRGLNQSLTDFAHETRQSLQDIARKASENKPIDAKIIGGVITVALFIVSGFFSVVGYGYSKDIDRIERVLERDHDLLVEHILSGGHVAMQARMSQSESDRNHLKSWVREHNEKVGGINSKQDAVIEALEREVFGGK